MVALHVPPLASRRSTLYEVTSLPPLLDGAVQVTEIDVWAGVSDRFCGALAVPGD